MSHLQDQSPSEMVTEALERAKHLNNNISDKIEIADLTLNSKLPFKALSLREILCLRFADLSLCAARALQSENPISAATLTRGSMETFARTLEFNDYLVEFFQDPNLIALDQFLMNRLFGARNREKDWPEATNVLTCIDKIDKRIPTFRENYDRLSEMAHPNYLGGLGTLQKLDTENHIVFLGDRSRKAKASAMIVPILIGNQIGFESIYNAIGTSIRALNDLLESGTLQH